MAIDLSGRNLVIGLGETGLSVAKYLAGRGAAFRVIDSRSAPPKLVELKASLPLIEVACGTTDIAWLDGIARVIVSPGLSHDMPLIREARARGLAVINDIELFAHAATAPIGAVTGSNGKSTVTTLVSMLLEARGLSVPAGGNLGPPALDLLTHERADFYVLEISSFQMEAAESLRPAAATVLNVTADHLDRHGSAERYANLKEKLLNAAEIAIVNHDDPIVRAMGARHARAVPVSIEMPLELGYSIVEVGHVEFLARNSIPFMGVNELGIQGRHNAFNALAAVALAEALVGLPIEPVPTLRSFTGLAHRCQAVARRGGVIYINDSKATNVGATIAAMRGMDGPLVLIAGGDSKGADLGPLADYARGKLKKAIVLGAAADELKSVLGSVCEVDRAATMDEAVEIAARSSRAGDTVLLSPACSSLDMFESYRHRGDAFVRAVGRLSP